MFALSVFSVTANKAKVFFGLLKEPELNIPLEDDDEGEGEGDATGKPKVSLQRRPRRAHSHIQKPELGERELTTPLLIRGELTASVSVRNNS